MAQIERRVARHRTRTRGRTCSSVKDEHVEFVLLWFTDLEGHLKSFAITPSELEGALDDGMGFDGSSITGFNAIEESDMVAIPDPATYAVLPHREGETKTGRMICDIVTPDGEPYAGDPRFVLKRALERMEAMGFDTFNVGPELEYFLFKGAQGPRPSTRAATSRRRRSTRPRSCAPRRSARSSRSGSASSTPTTRSARRSTRSTCATPTRSRWPTPRSPIA